MSVTDRYRDPQQIDRFIEEGFVRIDNAFPRSKASPKPWNALKRIRQNLN